MKKILTSVVIMLIAGMVTAQNEVEALRYSQTNFGGTARVQGVGGAFGAVGGDISSANINPAGLGLMRHNDFYGSLGFSNYRVTSDYIGTSTQAGRFSMNIPSFGVAGTSINTAKGREVKKGIVSNTFAFNHQRINNFQRNTVMNGNNNNSSILDYYAEITNGWTPGELDQYTDPIYLQELAWRTYLIDPLNENDPNNTDYVAAIYDSLTDVNQNNQIKNKGGMNEMNFAYAMNISNRIYLGFGLNVLTMRYEELNTFTEKDNPNDNSNNYRSSTSITDLTTRGNGMNTNIGAIVRVNDYFRFGASYQSATTIKVKDQYYYEMSSNFDDNDYLNQKTSVQDWEYRLKTPAKATVSAAIILGKKGFLSLDYEQVDYSKASLSAPQSASEYDVENNNIRTLYSRANNVRVGGELVEGMFRFRAGIAYYETPYNDRVLPDKRGKYATKSFSIGAGVFTKDFYLDAALINTQRTDFYTPYSLESRTYYTAENKLSNTNLVVTFGTKF